MTFTMTGAYAPSATCKHGVHPFDCKQGCDPHLHCLICGLGPHELLSWRHQPPHTYSPIYPKGFQADGEAK